MLNEHMLYVSGACTGYGKGGRDVQKNPHFQRGLQPFRTLKNTLKRLYWGCGLTITINTLRKCHLLPKGVYPLDPNTGTWFNLCNTQYPCIMSNQCADFCMQKEV